MSASNEAVFGVLSPEARGFVLGATLLGLDEAAAGCVAAPEGERCAAALATLSRLPREGKAARLGQLARELGAPYPPGLEVVHATWIRRVLSNEPTDLLAALVAGAPPVARAAAADVVSTRAQEAVAKANVNAKPSAADAVTLVPEIATELRRFVFSGLVPPIPAAGPAVAPLLLLSPEEFRLEVRRLGARSLGASLATAPVDIRARAMAGVGPALAQDLREAAATADTARRHEAESDVKAAAAEGPGGAEERLELIGLSALARLLRPESLEVRRAFALRLPTRLGRRLLPAEKVGDS